MIVRALSPTGDWTFGAGLNNYLSAGNAVTQAIATTLMMFLGDCFFATNTGIDWLNLLGGKNSLALSLSINSAILNIQSQGQQVVTQINSVNFDVNEDTRAFSVTYNVQTIYGTVTGTVNQNLGVGPLAPPAITPLLPQFNQPLLNNSSNVAITNAQFNSQAWWEVDLAYYIERRSSAGSYNQRGVLTVLYDPDLLTWEIDNVVLTGSSGPTSGVAFSINASTGQVSYSSDNLTGTGYVGNLIIGSTNTFPAGA